MRRGTRARAHTCLIAYACTSLSLSPFFSLFLSLSHFLSLSPFFSLFLPLSPILSPLLSSLSLFLSFSLSLFLSFSLSLFLSFSLSLFLSFSLSLSLSLSLSCVCVCAHSLSRLHDMHAPSLCPLAKGARSSESLCLKPLQPSSYPASADSL